jgi:hypothetical protein
MPEGVALKKHIGYIYLMSDVESTNPREGECHE